MKEKVIVVFLFLFYCNCVIVQKKPFGDITLRPNGYFLAQLDDYFEGNNLSFSIRWNQQARPFNVEILETNFQPAYSYNCIYSNATLVMQTARISKEVQYYMLCSHIYGNFIYFAKSLPDDPSISLSEIVSYQFGYLGNCTCLSLLDENLVAIYCYLWINENITGTIYIIALNPNTSTATVINSSLVNSTKSKVNFNTVRGMLS